MLSFLAHEIGWTGSQKQGGNVAANGVRGWSRANGIVCVCVWNEEDGGVDSLKTNQESRKPGE